MKMEFNWEKKLSSCRQMTEAILELNLKHPLHGYTHCSQNKCMNIFADFFVHFHTLRTIFEWKKQLFYIKVYKVCICRRSNRTYTHYNHCMKHKSNFT